MSKPQNALDGYLKDMMSALKSGAPHSALALAVSIPDICGSIEYPDKNIGERYVSWCDEWAAGLLVMSSADCYALRCAYLHSGKDEFAGPSAKPANFARIEFTLGTVGGGYVSTADPITQDGPKGRVRTPLEDFCRALVSGAIAWRLARSGDPRIVAAIADLMWMRPAGP